MYRALRREALIKCYSAAFESFPLSLFFLSRRTPFLSLSLSPCLSAARFPTLCGRCDMRRRLLVAQHVCVPATERSARIHADDAPLAMPLSASDHHFSPPPSRGARLPRESLREIARLNVKHECPALGVHAYIAYAYTSAGVSQLNRPTRNLILDRLKKAVLYDKIDRFRLMVITLIRILRLNNDFLCSQLTSIYSRN